MPTTCPFLANGMQEKVIRALLALARKTSMASSTCPFKLDAENSGEDSEGLDNVRLLNRRSLYP